MNSLQRDANAYLALRRGLGFKLQSHEVTLRELLAFLRQKKVCRITTKLALEFALRSPAHASKTQSCRLSVVRQFARYQFSNDRRIEIPALGLLPSRQRRAKPHFYSNSEIRTLLHAALNKPSLVSLQPRTFYCIFGLLAVSGMRVSEALNLQGEHIDWSAQMLTVHKSKFGKTRLIPLHPSTVAVLADYARRRKRYVAGRGCAPSPYFFVLRDGGRVHKSSVDRMFWALSRAIGLRGPTDSHGPRLHDFRHRFAVETLVRWYRNGDDVNQRLPELSTYLGHVNISDTYWYLSSTPELMAAAGKRLEKRWKGAA